MLKDCSEEKDATFDESGCGVEDYLYGDLYIKTSKGYRFKGKRKK